MIGDRPKVSFDTNILKKLSTKDWKFFFYKNYKPSDDIKNQIRKILTLGMSKIRLVISDTAFREFLGKNPRDEEFLEYIFTILSQDNESLVIIQELSTSLAKLYSIHRESGDPEPDIQDIKIYLESWREGCDSLLSEDSFLKSFQRFLQNKVSDINNSQRHESKEGKTRHLASGILNEDRVSTIISFIAILLSISLPKIFTLEEFLQEWGIDERDQDMLIERLLTFHEPTVPHRVTEEVRRAIIDVTDVQEKTTLIDELLGRIAPEIFAVNFEPPPFEEELDNIFSLTQKYLSDLGILSITVDIGLPMGYPIEVYYSGEIKAILEGGSDDFGYDNSFMWVEDEYGEPVLESKTEFGLETLTNLIREIEKEIKLESERKAKEWQDYWTSRLK